MNKSVKKQKIFIMLILVLCVLSVMYFISGSFFRYIGEFLIHDDIPEKSDAAVILSTGIEYYPRLVEAASIYKKGLAEKIVINGNRKTDSLRELEAMGFKPCCQWYENSLRILSLFDVPGEDVICVSAEDAYDTVTEAEIVGKEILSKGFNQIILVTSKSHTKRAKFIWKRIYRGKLSLCTVSAKTDPYDPCGWWRDGRQIRWVLSEYGSWIYYVWKTLKKD